MAGNIPIVVIGASAGGVEAVSQVARGLPPDFPGAVFVAMHFPVYSTSVLPRILERSGRLPASHPEDGASIEAGRIYVAPPDRHLIVLRGAIHLVRGPRENGNRPAIDPMFRSAAVAHGPRVVGVVLTGNLDDGTAGLLAISRRRGRTIVQDPAEALFPSMPASAVEHVSVDFVLPLTDIPAKLCALAADIAAGRGAAPVEVMMDDAAQRETSYAELDLGVVHAVDRHPGEPSQFGCPDCGGVLWEIEDGKLVRYRCRVGHAWSADGLLTSQAEQLDQALWVALRALEENVSLTESIAKRARTRGNDLLAAKYERDARSAQRRAQVIRDALLAGVTSASPSESEGKKAIG
jgi:two-component system, chemotaxis family, protein-glutamate methylesterase/glutaminase